MSIINGTFDTDLSGWTTSVYGCGWSSINLGVSGSWFWDLGRAHLHFSDTPLLGAGSIEQTFIADSNIIKYNLEFNQRQQYNGVSIQILDSSRNYITSNSHSSVILPPTDFTITIPNTYIGQNIIFYLTTRCYDQDGWGSGIVDIWLDNVISVPISMCITKRDEGIYTKDRYCYVGEGIVIKK